MSLRLESRFDEHESFVSSPSTVSVTHDTPNFANTSPQNRPEENSSAFMPPLLRRVNRFQKNKSQFPIPFPSSLRITPHDDPFLESRWSSQQAPPSPSACDEFQEPFEANSNHLHNDEEDQNDGFFLTLPTKPREYYFTDFPSSPQRLSLNTDTDAVSSPNHKKTKNNPLSPRQSSNHKECTVKTQECCNLFPRNDTSPTTIITSTTTLTAPPLREHKTSFLKPRYRSCGEQFQIEKVDKLLAFS